LPPGGWRDRRQGWVSLIWAQDSLIAATVRIVNMKARAQRSCPGDFVFLLAERRERAANTMAH
jgi:hypothetical protein